MKNLKKLKRNHNQIVPWIVATALFMETIDITILNNAVPVIANHFNESPLNLKLALTSYLISLGVVIPVSGYLSDRFGSKNILLLGISLFGIGSFLCGLAQSVSFLILFRILQGAGGALMMPVCRLILFKSFDKAQVANITNFATIPSLLGPALGPVIGGVIVTFFTWHWIFFVNIPFCLLLIYLTYFNMNNFVDHNVSRFDFPGFFIISLAILTIIFMVEAFSEDLISSKIAAVLFIVSLVLLVINFYFRQKTSNPFVDGKLFRNRTFAISILGSFFSRLGIGGITLLIPLILQINHKLSPLQASYYVVFYAIAMIFAKFAVRSILKKFGYRNTLIFNSVLIGISIASLVLMIESRNIFLISLLIFLNGYFTSIHYSCLNVLTYVDLSSDMVSKGTSIGSAISQLSMSFGVVYLVFFLRFFDYDNNLVGYDSYNLTIYLLSITLLLSSGIYLLLHKNAGSDASGHKIK